jgi:hypothetical protein
MQEVRDLHIRQMGGGNLDDRLVAGRERLLPRFLGATKRYYFRYLFQFAGIPHNQPN